MAKKKIKLSPGDKLSIFIASIALISAIFTTYFQFFHRTTEFRIGNVDYSNRRDSLKAELDISVLLINTGTNPVAFPEWYTFFSADGSFTEGVCYGNGLLNPLNTKIYTWGCSSKSNRIIEPNTLEFVNIKLEISNDILEEYLEVNQGSETDEAPFIKIGVRMYFIDSNGQKAIKEFIIGAIQYTDNSISSRMNELLPKELKIY